MYIDPLSMDDRPCQRQLKREEDVARHVLIHARREIAYMKAGGYIAHPLVHASQEQLISIGVPAQSITRARRYIQKELSARGVGADDHSAHRSRVQGRQATTSYTSYPAHLSGYSSSMRPSASEMTGLHLVGEGTPGFEAGIAATSPALGSPAVGSPIPVSRAPAYQEIALSQSTSPVFTSGYDWYAQWDHDESLLFAAPATGQVAQTYHPTQACNPAQTPHHTLTHHPAQTYYPPASYSPMPAYGTGMPAYTTTSHE